MPDIDRRRFATRRFLSEALPLVASYFSGKKVDLGPSEVSAEAEAAAADPFEAHIRLRHALAFTRLLLVVVERIEASVSSVRRMVREETLGRLVGRLDVPRYIARRTSALTWPRRYPVLVAKDSWDTPENAIVQRLLYLLAARLDPDAAPRGSAEQGSAIRLNLAVRNRLGRPPWNSIRSSANLARLTAEASRRVSRRQTGNEPAYSALLALVNEWWLTDQATVVAGQTRLVGALLAFPNDELFEDRIFEIWCLQALAAALVRAGAVNISGPRPLHRNKAEPIFEFVLGGDAIQLWFQKALPSEKAEWTYTGSGASLRAIPDVTAIRNGTDFLLVDAKNRFVTTNTRSEESYKMLGYFENYRGLRETGALAGLLCFVSDSAFYQELKSRCGEVVSLVSAHPEAGDLCHFATQIDIALRQWIDRGASGARPHLNA